MAFQKTYKVVQDSPGSFELVNQLADNQADLRTQLFVEHGIEEPLPYGKPKGAPAFDYHRLGRHDLAEVPRTVAQALLFLQSSSLTGVTSNIQFNWTGPGLPFVFKYATGSFLLPVIGLKTWWAKASVLGGAGLTYLEPQVRPFYASQANGNNSGIRIYTYKLVSGDFVLTDASFSIALYGDPA